MLFFPGKEIRCDTEASKRWPEALPAVFLPAENPISGLYHSARCLPAAAAWRAFASCVLRGSYFSSAMPTRDSTVYEGGDDCANSAPPAARRYNAKYTTSVFNDMAPRCMGE